MLLLTITTPIIIAIAAGTLLVGLAVGYFITSTLLKKAVTKEETALLEEAKEKAEVIKKERILQAKVDTVAVSGMEQLLRGIG